MDCPDLFIAGALESEEEPAEAADNALEIYRRAANLKVNIKLNSFRDTSRTVEPRSSTFLAVSEGKVLLRRRRGVHGHGGVGSGAEDRAVGPRSSEPHVCVLFGARAEAGNGSAVGGGWMFANLESLVRRAGEAKTIRWSIAQSLTWRTKVAFEWWSLIRQG